MKHKTKPKNRPPTRFDPLWRNATVAYGELQKYTRRLQSNVREVRRHAYRFTDLAGDVARHLRDRPDWDALGEPDV